MNAIYIEDQSSKKKFSNFHLFKKIRKQKCRLLQNQKPGVPRIWSIRSEFFWSHIKEQLILGRGTVEKSYNWKKYNWKTKQFKKIKKFIRYTLSFLLS